MNGGGARLPFLLLQGCFLIRLCENSGLACQGLRGKTHFPKGRGLLVLTELAVTNWSCADQCERGPIWRARCALTGELTRKFTRKNYFCQGGERVLGKSGETPECAICDSRGGRPFLGILGGPGRKKLLVESALSKREEGTWPRGICSEATSNAGGKGGGGTHLRKPGNLPERERVMAKRRVGKGFEKRLGGGGEGPSRKVL